MQDSHRLLGMTVKSVLNGKTISRQKSLIKSDRIEDLLIETERIFAIAGIWPLRSGYFKFVLYIAYFTLHLIMSFVDLFTVFGDLERMVMNLVETVVFLITYSMCWMIRCSGLLRKIIVATRKEIAEQKFENDEEEKIYYSYNNMTRMFFKVSIFSMVMTTLFLYARPLLNIGLTAQVNATQFYVIPYRIYVFFDVTDPYTYALVYLYLFPTLYISICHMAAICILVTLVFHICAELSILSYRISNITPDSLVGLEDRIRDLVQMHLKTIWMGKMLDDAFHIILLDELLGNSVVMGISMYYVLMNASVSKMASLFTSVFFVSTAFLMLFGFCFIGDQLIQQSARVRQASYECDWPDMPIDCKKAMQMCMIRAEMHLSLTGGKFYIFSLPGFTDVMKTSFAYVSMLRTLL